MPTWERGRPRPLVDSGIRDGHPRLIAEHRIRSAESHSALGLE